MPKSIAEQCKDRGSQRDKTVACVSCGGEIPPYTGRAVAMIGEHWQHQAGKCIDQAPRLATLRQVAQQGSLFAWECRKVTPGTVIPVKCSVAGMAADTLADHMLTEHGRRPITPSVAPIKLRKRPPVGQRIPPAVPPFKRIVWTTTTHMPTGETHPPELGGGPVYAPVTTEHRGQFWANGESGSVHVIEDMRAAGLPNRVVTLYLTGDGRLISDWSDARRSRRRANEIKRDRKRFAAA